MTVTDSEAMRRPIEGVVTDDGALVVSAEAVQEHGFVPGQRVRVTVSRRRNMRGVLAGQLPDIPLEDFDEVSRDSWDDEWAT